MAMRTASGSTSPIEGSSCRARRTRSHASGIDGLSLVSGTIQVAQLASDLDVGLVDPP